MRSLPVLCLILLLLLLLLFVSMHIVLRRRLEYVEVSIPCIADFKNTGQIPATIAVVGRAPYGAESIIVQYLVALLTQLMGS